MASCWCSYHPGVSPNASGKKKQQKTKLLLLLIIIIITVIGSVLKAERGNDVFIPPRSGWWPTVTSPPGVKLLRKWKGTAPREWRCRSPLTVDLLYQTMGRHCLESGYIKILKTAWEGKKIIISNDACKKSPSCIMQKIYFYIHIRTYTYIPFIIAQISRKICIDS